MDEMQGTLPDITADLEPPDSLVDVGPLIASTAALEVSYRGEPSGSSADPATIASVVQIVSERALSKGSGTPRCMPSIWVRFVPPSAEGGVTALFCDSAGSAYFWLPGEDAAVLDVERSGRLYAALSDPAVFTGPRLLPVAVEQSDTMEIFFKIRSDGEAPATQTLSFLAGSIRTEPSLIGPDGAPLDEPTTLSAEGAESLARDLLSEGFFARAKRYHSPATASATEPPPGSEVGPPPGPTETQPAQVQVTIVEGDWHRTWSEVMHPATFANLVTTLQKSGSLGERQAELDAMNAAIQP